MTRQEELNNFQSEIHDKKTFGGFWKEMQNFLQHDDDYTKELQKDIGKALEEDFDNHVSFDNFLKDYADKHPHDTAGYDSLHSKIFS
jgi:uncharacterized protein YbcC (UPF0753/DUF2309 family)